MITKRYAGAYVLYAKPVLGIEKIVDEFKALKGIISDNPQFVAFLRNPEITDTEKYQFIDAVLRDAFSEELRIFLKLLVEKARIVLLEEICDFIRIHYAHGEVVEAVLETAYPLDLEMISRIERKLEEKLGKRLYFYLKIDGSLLGGVRATVGNTVIDGSLKKRLEDIFESIKEAKAG